MSALAAEHKDCNCLQRVYDEVFSSKCYSYKLLSILGEGRFGIVAKCFNLNTSDRVAVKLLKRCNMNNFHQEVQALQKIRFLDKNRNSLVKFIEHFIFQDFPCLVFEMLDKSLEDLMTERNMTPLNLHQIRPVMSQLLMAFEALQALGVTHTDLKPDNVMLVDHKNLPFRVKLIDFGLARPISSVHVGMTLQAEAYRAPEVILGLPLSEAIDMWSLGCTVAYLFFGFDLFDCSSLRGTMETICRLLGQPADHLLNEAKYSSEYFTVDDDEHWTVMSAGTKLAISRFNLDLEASFEDLAMMFLQSSSTTEYDDLLKFVCLLKWFQSVDAGSRATPRQGLNHAFVTMTHLTDNNAYKETTLACMAVAPIDDYITVRGSDEGYGDEEPDGVQDLYGEDQPSEAVDGRWVDAQDVALLDGKKSHRGIEDKLGEAGHFDGEEELGWEDADHLVLFGSERDQRVVHSDGGVVKKGGKEVPVGLVDVCDMINLNGNPGKGVAIDGGMTALCGVPGGLVEAKHAVLGNNESADEDGEVDDTTECLIEKKEASRRDRQTGSDSKFKVKSRSRNQESSKSVFSNCLQM
ncbi:homeodomain-interacting protein kinase 2-like [Vanacampus margaritifer]